MPEQRDGTTYKDKTHADSESPTGKPVRDAPAPLVKSVEAKEAYPATRYQEEPPSNFFLRWLWKYAQSIMSVLTVFVLVFYAIQWVETRNTRELENRAYITAKGVSLQNVTFQNVNDVFVTVVNAGRTPGRKGNIVAQLERRQSSPPEDTVINPPEGQPATILFGPQIDVSHRAGFMDMIAPPIQVQTPPPNPSPEREARPSPSPSPSPTPTPAPPSVNDQDQRLWYLYGVVTYEDIFGNGHKTKFCFQNQPFTRTWSFCPTYNNAD